MPRKKFDRDIIVDTYKKIGKITTTAEVLGINEKTVRVALKEKGIVTTPRELRNRKYFVDDSFFKKIDTQEKAYILGFVCADGHINARKTCYNLVIELSQKDESILKKIKSCMKSNHPISRRTRPPVRPNGRETKCSSLIISRKCLVQDLKRLGLETNKTWSLSIPSIDKKLFSHWLRGFIDGDGCISIDGENRASVNFVSTISVSDEIIRRLKENNIVARQSINYSYTKPLANTLITNRKEIFKLRDFIYNNCSICLERKLKIFNEVTYAERDYYGENNPFWGKKHSKKTKETLININRGEKNNNNKLTVEDVKKIKGLLDALSAIDLASKFKISVSTIRSIKRGDTWGWVKV